MTYKMVCGNFLEFHIARKNWLMLLENNNASISVNVRECRFRNRGNFCLWNLEYWALDSGIQLKETRITLTIVIRNASSIDKESRILNPESSTMKSRIQDCLGLPRMEQGITSKTGKRGSPSPGLVTMAIMTRFQSSYPGSELTEQCPSMGRGRGACHLPPNNFDRHV